MARYYRRRGYRRRGYRRRSGYRRAPYGIDPLFWVALAVAVLVALVVLTRCPARPASAVGERSSTSPS
jgi:hypothetical protein